MYLQKIILNAGARLLPYTPSKLSFQFIGDSLSSVSAYDITRRIETNINFRATYYLMESLEPGQLSPPRRSRRNPQSTPNQVPA